MSEVIGLEAKLYYDASGMSETPTWTELTNVKDVTLNLEKADADVTTRASGGWRLRRGTLKDARVEWEMQWDVFPTHVGVNRQGEAKSFTTARLPHTRGGEPDNTSNKFTALQSSPHTWG